jgi:hypothetical protein
LFLVIRAGEYKRGATSRAQKPTPQQETDQREGQHHMGGRGPEAPTDLLVPAHDGMGLPLIKGAEGRISSDSKKKKLIESRRHL